MSSDRRQRLLRFGLWGSALLAVVAYLAHLVATELDLPYVQALKLSVVFVVLLFLAMVLDPE